MIQLLFLVLFAEGAAALLLMVKVGPLRELAMRGVDQVKTGKGPATVKTLTCILKIQNKGLKLGTVSPMDQLLWRTQLLEASLIDDWRNKMANVQTSDGGKKARSKAPFSLRHLNIPINNALHVSVVQEFSLLLQGLRMGAEGRWLDCGNIIGRGKKSFDLRCG